ncbi:hypothetical protein SerAS12_2711 [Serratia sp. AS12]|uniref:hypothetical protein n=1 Tax=Serratia TaxID=613 RepID=UPI00020EA0BF|nr:MULTISPECIES: hypothetical protein [Serratia]AEF45831.1 hypothetical protein SerAS9_2710 [Serratia plymuthica AS9]AEF50782.1 hypothetical protein SerAS12_2711 [Serratia sp. AS12]AEG28489.1 hypothetical protein SerAS13_2712 [Serratia sp. AS13]UTN94589.1 hypothetical protein NLX81_13815 [Serratia plymuthica]
MSLESNLELNNKLVAEQNGLLTQLLAALAGGKTFTADTPHQPKAESKTGTKGKEARKGPFYAKHNGTEITFMADTWDDFEKADADSPYGGITEITKVEFLQLKEHSDKKVIKPITLEEQPLPVAVALAVIYGAKPAVSLTPEMMTHAVNITETTDGDERDAQIDALTMALKGVDRAKKMHGTGVFDLALQLVEHWDALPGITERRAYAELLLDTPKEKRADVKPAKPKATTKGKTTAAETVTTSAEGEAPDAAALLEQGKQLIIQKIAPKAPADLRKTLDLFGLKKLTDCPEEKLPDVVAALEQLAEALEA